MMICGEAKEAVSCLADLLFPPICATCGALLSGRENKPFCTNCSEGIKKIAPPVCTSCGLPLTGHGENHLCEGCILSPPCFTIARALGRYEGPLLEAIHLFKYQGRISLGENLGRMMVRGTYSQLSIEDFSLVVPVPLHPNRLRARGFNQSLILARQIATHFSLSLSYRSLIRSVDTEAQVRLSGKGRRTNVSGAFEVIKIDKIKGESILLVDDVYTTGNTAMECSKVLIKNGAQKVAILTLARA